MDVKTIAFPFQSPVSLGACRREAFLLVVQAPLPQVVEPQTPLRSRERPHSHSSWTGAQEFCDTCSSTALSYRIYSHDIIDSLADHDSG